MNVAIHAEDVRQFFDAQSLLWDSLTRRDPELLRSLLAWLPLRPGDAVLDVGTGTGVLLPYIRERDPQGEIDAVDLSPGMLAVARQKYGDDEHIHFISADVSSETFHAGIRQLFSIRFFRIWLVVMKQWPVWSLIICSREAICLLRIPRGEGVSMINLATDSIVRCNAICFQPRCKPVVSGAWD